jgi:hypothetical protein
MLCRNIKLYYSIIRTALGPIQPPVQWVPGPLFLEVKLSGCEADHSPPSRAEVKECLELYFHSPHYAFMAWCSVKKIQRQLYLYLIIVYKFGF